MSDYVMNADHPGLAMDRGVQDVLGKGIDRIDGVLKVMGAATYGYEHQVGDDVAYGYLITAQVAKGKVIRFDTDAARALPGVLDIIIDDPRIPRQAAGFVPAKRGNAAVDHWDQVLGAAIA
ncbi:MAG: xanthine dehydrogenase family protein molybdopterin-binding subunit, partial [Sphingomonas sp.]